MIDFRTGPHLDPVAQQSGGVRGVDLVRSEAGLGELHLEERRQVDQRDVALGLDVDGRHREVGVMEGVPDHRHRERSAAPRDVLREAGSAPAPPIGRPALRSASRPGPPCERRCSTAGPFPSGSVFAAQWRRPLDKGRPHPARRGPSAERRGRELHLRSLPAGPQGPPCQGIALPPCSASRGSPPSTCRRWHPPWPRESAVARSRESQARRLRNGVDEPSVPLPHRATVR